MKIITNVIDKSRLKDYLKNNIDCLIVGHQSFSSRHGKDFEIDEIRKLKQLMNENQLLYVSVNQFYNQMQLEELNQYLFELNKLNVNGILFQDFSIIQLKKEHNYNFDLIYDPLTLNTNGQTLNYLKTLGINSFFLSREISIKDIREIVKNDLNLIIQLDGVRHIAQSKRMLVTHYFDTINQNNSLNQHYIIQPEKTNIKNYIYEDYYGTHILSKNRLFSFNVLEQLLFFKISYGYINGLMMNFEEQIKIIQDYQKAIKLYPSNEYKDFIATIKLNDSSSDEGFYHDSTIYTLEDVRKRDANEKNK